MYNGKSILVTGGTGSFGKAFARKVLESHPELKKLVIFSRDELKQYEMSCEPGFVNEPRIRFFLGDIRDSSRVRRALEDIDIVVHAAALKQVPAAEYNPFECIKTNILGAQNVIEGCLDTGVSKVIALSTDKAAAPINLYGATKLCSDKLFTAANSIVGSRDLRFSVVRYGNVMGSRGSVIPLFLKMKKQGVLTITDPNMTRFNICLDEGVEMVLWSLRKMQGGEIFVPKIPSYKITDVAKAICPDCEIQIIGTRPGEKVHEEMITESDAAHTVDFGKYFAILASADERQIIQYIKNNNVKRITPNSAYKSDTNPNFLSADDLRKLIENFETEYS